ncbi:unnamed protein product [Discula destructiva]
MSNVNVVAIATGAFLGLLALVAAVACVPPITRFLGDLFCCPWRIPFTKKKKRNADEEVGDDELPYVVEPRADNPVDTAGYQHMSNAHMSAVSVVDPALAKEEMRRSAERLSADYRRSHSGGGNPNPDPFYHPHDQNGSYYSYDGQTPSSPTDYHHQHHYGNQLDVPPAAPPHGGSWRDASASQERLRNASSPAYASSYEAASGHSPPDQHPDTGYHDRQYLQRPPPSFGYSPSEAASHSSGYFPSAQYDPHDNNRHQPAAEQYGSGGGRGHHPHI